VNRTDTKRVTIPTADLEAAMERYSGSRTSAHDLTRWLVKMYGQGETIFGTLDFPETGEERRQAEERRK